MNLFLDSSALVKFFLKETGSDTVSRFMLEDRHTILTSSLTRVEIVSATAVKVRSREISEDAGLRALRQILVSVALGELGFVAVTSTDYRAAARLIEKWGFQKRLRSLDSVQLAVASRLWAMQKLDYL